MMNSNSLAKLRKVKILSKHSEKKKRARHIAVNGWIEKIKPRGGDETIRLIRLIVPQELVRKIFV